MSEKGAEQHTEQQLTEEQKKVLRGEPDGLIRVGDVRRVFKFQDNEEKE